MPPQPPLVTSGLSNPQVQDQQFAGALQSRGMQIPFSQLAPGAGENLTPPVGTGGVPQAHLPEWNRPASSMGGPAEGQKKALLQKLMSNLLGKPGRSFHELTNGIKQALATYKSFANELDNLHGSGMSQTTPQTSKGGVQDVLRGIQQKKDGGGGPGYGAGGPGYFANNAPPSRGMSQLPQTPTPPQPIHQINPPQPPLIAGRPQNTTFNQPAPVNSLGIWGY